MGAKDELKKLMAGEIPPIVDGIYTDGKKVYKVSGSVSIYSKKKVGEDVSKLLPIKLLEKLKEGATMIFAG